MAEMLEEAISNFAKAKKALIRAQDVAKTARISLMKSIIEHEAYDFLTLDENALKREIRITDWQQFPDS